jgi:hypothetical protein
MPDQQSWEVETELFMITDLVNLPDGPKLQDTLREASKEDIADAMYAAATAYDSMVKDFFYRDEPVPPEGKHLKNRVYKLEKEWTRRHS